MRLLKNLLYIFFCALLITSCSSKSNSKLKIAAEDTSYIPPPGKISKDEFEKYYRAVKSFYESFLLPRGFNGALLVAKKGTIIFEAYHGFANASKKDTINEHSAFHLASVSKTFTAMGILKLVEQ